MHLKDIVYSRNHEQTFRLLKQKIKKQSINLSKKKLLRAIISIKNKYYSSKSKEYYSAENIEHQEKEIVLSPTNRIGLTHKTDVIDINYNIIKYIENRAWFSCCRLNKKKLSTLNNLTFLKEAGSKLTILNYKNLSFSKGIKHMFYYESFEYIELELNENGIGRFNELFTREEDSKLFAFKIRIFDAGVVNTLAYFDLHNCYNIESFEKKELDLNNIIDNINKEIITLFDNFIHNDFIIKTEYLYWGVPKFIKNKDITYNHSYLYECHFFIQNKSLYDKITSTLNINKEERFIQYGDLFVTALPNEGFMYWTGKFEKDRVDYLNINFILLAEENVYATARLIGIYILRYINSHNSFHDYQFRSIFNYFNEVILLIKNTDLAKSTSERQFTNSILKLNNLNESYELYKDTEERLKYAIESIEVKKNQENNKFIQNIFAIFTGLTLFSVLNDVFSFLSSNKIFDNSFILFKSALLFIICIILSLSLYVINKKER